MIMTDAQCAEILESVEDYLESRESDYDPAMRWAGDSWRVGRSALHTSRINEMASSALPPWVVEGAERHYESLDSSVYRGTGRDA